MSEFTIMLTGGSKLKTKLATLEALDLKPEFIQIGEYLKDYYSGEGFLSQGQVFGKPWPPLKNSAGKSKSFVGQPLERTGTMRNAFEFDAKEMEVKISNPTPYFPFHQSSAPRRVLPRRVMLGFNGTIKGKARGILKLGIKRIIDE